MDDFQKLCIQNNLIVRIKDKDGSLIMNTLINVRHEVELLLGNDVSGHGMDHIDRTLFLALDFAKETNANRLIVCLIALLHDVDDYKLFGQKHADELSNAMRIMEKCQIDQEIIQEVILGIQNIGFSKRLKGLVPHSLEAKIVSDADMCDAMGMNGILRTYAFSLSKGQPFFDKNIFPSVITNTDDYKKERNSTGICHVFEKLLRLKDFMLTPQGKKEASIRHDTMIYFLYHFFKEENADQWISYLHDYPNN